MLQRKIESLKKPLVIFVCGVPGTRKSSTAVQLAAKLGIKIVIGTDQIRDVLRPHINNPFLEGATHNRWQLIGERTPGNIIKGYLTQSALLKRDIMTILELARNRGENIIIEGVHLFPGLYQELNNDPNLAFFHFLLSAENEDVHRRNIALKIRLRHGKEKDWPEEKIKDIREIQRFLLASNHNYAHLIDSETVQDKIKKIMGVLEESLCKEA